MLTDILLLFASGGGCKLCKDDLLGYYAQLPDLSIDTPFPMLLTKKYFLNHCRSSSRSLVFFVAMRVVYHKIQKYFKLFVNTSLQHCSGKDLDIGQIFMLKLCLEVKFTQFDFRRMGDSKQMTEPNPISKVFDSLQDN